MSNKSRKDARAAVQLVARYRSPTVFSFVEERCYDISKGGMFIGSSSPASVGTLLKLECDEDSGDKLQAVARVVWTRDSSDDFGPAGMGVKFVKIEKGGSQVLERMLDGRASLVDGGERYRGSLAPPPPASEPPASSNSTPASATAAAPSASTRPSAERTSERPAAEATATSDQAPGDTAPASERPSQPTGETVAANVRRDSKRPASVPAASSRPPLGKSKSDWTMGLAAAGVLLIAVLFQSMRSSDSDEERPAASNASEAQAEQEAPAQPAAVAPTEPSNPPAADRAAEVEAPAGEVPSETDTEQAAEDTQPEGTAEEPETAEPGSAETAEATAEAAPAAEVAPAAEADTPAEAEVKAAKQANDSAAEPAAGSYVVTVITRPGGARVTLRGKELYAPGDFTFMNFPEPARIEADKVGFRPTAGTVDPKDFESDEGLMKRRIYLVLKPEE